MTSSSTITADTPLLTFVNIFTCEPADQDALVATLQSETDQIVKDLPGFVSANIHKSKDGCRVANYAQWTSVNAFQSLMGTDKGRQMMAEVRKYATDIDIHLYSVETVHDAPAAP